MSLKGISNEKAPLKVRGLKIEGRIHFLKLRKFSLLISLLIIGVGVVLYFLKGGFRLGIDFVGGTRLEVKIDNQEASVANIREMFVHSGENYEVTTVGDPSLKVFLITFSASGEADAQVNKVAEIESKLKEAYGEDKVQVRGSGLVGPKIGENTGRRFLRLMLIVSVMILIYAALRFDLLYGVGAIAALFHDLLIMLAFTLMFDIQLDTISIAAFLTILGYSINDTIVVFDRVRENHKLNPDEDFELVMDRSITHSLSRTIITSITTLFVAVALFIWGGRVLHNFALLLIIGLISGTYSSIFVASPITFMLRNIITRVGQKEQENKRKTKKANA